MSSYIFIQNKKCESLKVSDGKAIQTPKNTGELIERNKNPADKKRVLWGINFLFFQSIRIMYCRFELCLWPFLSISFLKAVLVYPKNIFVIFDNFECSVERRRRFNINDRIKELGGLLPTQVTNDGQLGVQQWTIFCPTINNWVSNNGWNLQSWTPIMVNNVPGWIKLCSFNFLIICSRVNRIMTWWGMFVRTRVRFWRWKKCWNCYCLFDNL